MWPKIINLKKNLILFNDDFFFQKFKKIALGLSPQSEINFYNFQ